MTRQQRIEALQLRIRTLENKISECEASLDEMEKREEWYSQIVQGTPIATFVIDGQHRVVTCNKAYERLTGIPTREIIGTDQHWRAFYDRKRPVLADLIVDNASEEVIAEYYPKQYRKSATIDGAYEVEGLFPTLGENGKWLFFTAAPLTDAQGNITGALETLQDTTEQKRALQQLIESERRLRILFEFAPYPIVVFRSKGTVYYLNPAFTEIFGWTFEELDGGPIPFEPEEPDQPTAGMILSLLAEASPRRYETKRVTKDGRILDVVIRATRYADARGNNAGVLMFLRDVTQQKQEARNTETIHKISLALPAYPDLKALLDFISGEIRRLVSSEGALVLLLDEERDEIVILSAAYEDPAIQKRIKQIRFPLDTLVAGEVIKTGESIIVNDASRSDTRYRLRDEKLGYQTRNLVLVPLHGRDRIIGVLGAVNKHTGTFEPNDVELLNTIGSTVALSIENARFAQEVKTAYQTVKSLNRAKDKVIQHLSHELKTPVAVLAGSLTILSKQLDRLEDTAWQPTVHRARRNLDRIVAIQDEVSDIMEDRRFEVRDMLSTLLDGCSDELETLLVEEVGEGDVVRRVRDRIDDMFGPKALVAVNIALAGFVGERLKMLTGLFFHREVRVHSDLESTPAIWIPREPLEKIVDGLIRNAVENTPDGGKVEVRVHQKANGSEMVIRDYGVGIPEDDQKRIFEGFFPTCDTMAYSSKRPYDFLAGGRGADLLRMKIFSERYGFDIQMTSSKCRYIPGEKDDCPGSIADCPHCTVRGDCFNTGGTTFLLYFPPAG